MIDWNHLKSMGPRERVAAFAPLIRELLERCTGERLSGARALASEMLASTSFVPSQGQVLGCANSVQATEDERDFDGNMLAGLVLFLAVRLLPAQERTALGDDAQIGPCLLDDTVFDALGASEEVDDTMFRALNAIHDDSP